MHGGSLADTKIMEHESQNVPLERNVGKGNAYSGGVAWVQSYCHGPRSGEQEKRRALRGADGRVLSFQRMKTHSDDGRGREVQ